MPGLLHITLAALLTSCDVLALGVSQHSAPLSGLPALRRLHDRNAAVQPRLLQELVRTKRHSALELVRTQPHLVHDMGWPEIHETSRSHAKTDAANSSQASTPSTPGQGAAKTHDAVDENRGVEDAMERMVHLAVPQDSEDYREQPEAGDPETEHLAGPGGGDASQEASGFYGTDTEDRERGEEGGEDRERRGGEDEWEREKGEDRETRGGDAREEEEEEEEERADDVLDLLEVNHTTPDLDALIGYSPSFHPSSSQQPGVSFPVEAHDSGPQEHRVSPVLEAGLVGRELWEAELEEEVQASGYGVPRSSVTAVTSTVASFTPPPPPPPAAAAGDSEGTATPETDTGTDFGLLGGDDRDEKQEGATASDEDDGEAGLTRLSAFTQKPTAPEVGPAPSREPLQPSVEEEEEQLREAGRRFNDPEEEEERKEPRNRLLIPLTTVDTTCDWPEKTTPLHTQQQIVCLDWSELAGRGYVILNMTHNLNCEEFRVDQGVRLLRIMEEVFARRMNSPVGSWMIYLSKPTHQQHQLLMNVASENGVIATKDVLDMLGEIRKRLDSVGIQNYSAASSCQSRPSQTRSDYGKLFVVLVIIGSICMVIITSGFIYICWQRRLPATKTTFRAEELHFVENGCHDNPMLDVTNDSQPEMREKKPSTNGLAGGGEGGGEESSRWQVFVNQAATEEEEEEQDTHL